MRIGLKILILIAVLTGCRNRDADSMSSIGSNKSTFPRFVLSLADDYITSSVGKQDEDDDYVKKDFCRGFLMGFMEPGSTISSSSGRMSAWQQGFVTGQKYHRENPQKTKEIMEGFGYTLVEYAGVWTTYFEHSEFCPDELRQQRWWLSSFGDMKFDLLNDEKIAEKGVHIKVRGYLSPSGAYGHLGGYSREFLAISISKIDD